jgi:hypothetical protein
MGHVVLLGDSIFDNGAYVPGEPDVVRQLRREIPADWEASLVAVDGAVVGDVPAQLRRLPPGATHLVMSAGGNDALCASHLLGEAVRSVAEAVVLLGEAQARFAAAYGAACDALAATGLPVMVASIYDTPASAPNHRVIRTALSLFNDEISRAAFARGFALLDLRLVCSEERDYANPIEPSSRGGAKMAAAIAAFAAGRGGRRSAVISG